MSNDRQAKIAAASSSPRSPRRTMAALIVALVVVVGVIAAVVIGTRSQDAAEPQSIPSSSGSGSGTSGAPAVKLAKGVADATSPVVASNGGVLKPGIPTLQIFEDFQCPACKHAEDALGATIKDMGAKGQVNVVYYVKTFLDDNLRNDSSKAVGNAALCAADAGKFEDYHDKIYAKQPTNEGDGYTAAQIEQAATEAGISGAALDTWKQCVATKPYVAYLQSLEDYTSRTLKVTSTPSFYVNNKRLTLTDGMTADAFRALVLQTAGQ